MALAAVLQHAASERDEALAALRRAEQMLRPLQAQVDQLLNYRGEYQARWSRQFGQRGEMEIVHCYSSFMQRLDEALAGARQRVQHAGAQVERLRARLLATELRVASVTKLIERRLAEQQRVQRRRDQRQTDETAQHVAARRSALHS